MKTIQATIFESSLPTLDEIAETEELSRVLSLFNYQFRNHRPFDEEEDDGYEDNTTYYSNNGKA